tara:strand:+ start:33 stop:1775 length:1743 start_codon:yes stop_codon:yes gene_type:complete
MKPKVSLIGRGKWGLVLERTLLEVIQTDFVEPKDAEWIFLATPNDLHYDQVKYWLNQKKNVFCEKPLTLSYESAKELFELADSQRVALYVDDVFRWRDDLNSWPFMPVRFQWSKSDNTNFIDRLAYHHFYLWTQDRDDVEVKSVSWDLKWNSVPDMFTVSLYGGLYADFDYSRSGKTIHKINGENVKKSENNALKDMLNAVIYDYEMIGGNRNSTLNAIKISEAVRKKLYPKALVVGGGIFGTTAAVGLKNSGYNVKLTEKLDDVMKGASDINQYRIHKGFHYPRSNETAESCLEGTKTFERKYDRSIMNGNIQHLYCIASEDSLVTPSEYLKFLDYHKLKYTKVDPLPNTDLTVEVNEKLFNNNTLRELVKDKLYGNGIDLELNSEADWVDFKNYDLVVLATYANINQYLRKKQDYQFELCEKPVVKLPEEYSNKSIVVMDGPFMCLDPYGDTGYHVLGNVVHAIHETNIGPKPIVKSRTLRKYLNDGVIKNPKVTNIKKFIETGMKFFEDFDKLEHIGSMYTFRTVLRDREHDDARPTLVRKEKSPYNIYSLFSGKITTCVDATNELIKLVNQEKHYG